MTEWLPASLQTSSEKNYNRSLSRSIQAGLKPKRSVAGTTQKKIKSNTMDFFPNKRNQHSDCAIMRNSDKYPLSPHSKSKNRQKPKRSVTEETDTKTSSSSTLGSILDQETQESENNLDRKRTKSRSTSRVDKDSLWSDNKDIESSQRIIIENSH